MGSLSWIWAPLLLFSVCSSKWSSVRFVSALAAHFSLHAFIHHLVNKLVCAVYCVYMREWVCRVVVCPPVSHAISSATIKSTHVCLPLCFRRSGQRAFQPEQAWENMFADAADTNERRKSKSTAASVCVCCVCVSTSSIYLLFVVAVFVVGVVVVISYIFVFCVRNFHLEKVSFNT